MTTWIAAGPGVVVLAYLLILALSPSGFRPRVGVNWRLRLEAHTACADRSWFLGLNWKQIRISPFVANA